MTNTTVNPSEVGWQFVPQYYTFVNKQPNRLHCFYTKASTFIHGTEGEDGKPCYGQQEIHAKITSIGFNDCKVFIHSVDAQSSANGGIIIQVIGEMSNAGEPWKKFVQTFFLAEQPNGYFVLNDIFRFLKEDTVEDEPIEEGEPVEEAPESEPAPPSSPPPATEPEPEPEPTPTLIAPAPVAEEPAVPPPSEPEPEPETNGVVEPEPTPAPAPESPSQPEEEAPATASPAPVSSAPPSKAATPAPAPAPTAAPTQAPAPVTATPPQPVAPVPIGPPPTKTWANLAASGRSKWGSAITDAKGVSEAPASASSTAPPSASHSPAPHSRIPPQQHPAYITASQTSTAQCFVKGVIESVSDSALRNTLTQRFGPIKDLDIHRPKACAFLEFQSVEAARRAIIVSLQPAAGGEGGIRITEGIPDGENPPRIYVETRKERGDRPVPRGPPNSGDRGRGGFRGRGGPGGGRGRGAPPQQK